LKDLPLSLSGLLGLFAGILYIYLSGSRIFSYLPTAGNFPAMLDGTNVLYGNKSGRDIFPDPAQSLIFPTKTPVTGLKFPGPAIMAVPEQGACTAWNLLPCLA
jgi:hypothetical protein